MTDEVRKTIEKLIESGELSALLHAHGYEHLTEYAKRVNLSSREIELIKKIVKFIEKVEDKFGNALATGVLGFLLLILFLGGIGVSKMMDFLKSIVKH